MLVLIRHRLDTADKPQYVEDGDDSFGKLIDACPNNLS